MESKLQILIDECLFLVNDIPNNRDRINQILDVMSVDDLIRSDVKTKSKYVKIMDEIEKYYESISNIINPIDTLLDNMNESNKELYTKYLDTFSKL